MNPSDGLEEFADALWSNFDDDGKSTAGTLIINQAGTRASHATNTSEKRGRIPLDDEEKKRRKKIADKKHRDKCKAILKETKEELQTTKEKVGDLERENKSLNKERNLMAQDLENSTTEVGQLKSKIKRMNETIVAQQQQIAVLCRNQGEVGMEEELRGLKRKTCELELMNRSLMAERETMTKHLQIATLSIEQLQSQIYTLDATIAQQQQLLDLYSNGQNHEQELPMEQVQLWQEENGRLALNTTIGQQQQQLLKYFQELPVEQKQLLQEENERLVFVGDGHTIATSISKIQPMVSEMSQQVEKWKREAEEARNDHAETKKQMDEVLAEMRTMKAAMFEYMKSRNV